MICEHEQINPIVEVGHDGQLVVFTSVCTRCFQEFPVNPMTLEG